MATSEKKFSFAQMCFVGSCCGVMCELVTMPLDTVKVRMQVFQNRYKSFSQSALSIFREEKISGFYKGLSPAILRQLFFATFRMGFFDLSIQKIGEKKGFENINVIDRAVSGLISGAIGITIANPFDMLKVRFQSDFHSNTKRYKNVFSAINEIYHKEGIKAFYQSYPPNLVRNSIYNAAELATYTQFKAYFLKNQIFKQEGISLFLTCSFLAGLFAVSFGSPFDVVKTRMMEGKVIANQKVLYSSISECVFTLFKEKGIQGFYAGFVPNLQRVISGNIVMFLTREFVFSQLKSK